MKTLIDQETWIRKDHFKFFSQFEEPFFGFTVKIDCTELYAYSKANGYSFFLYSLHKSLLAVNQIEEFRCRILDGEVWRFDAVHASPTINRPDGTFGYAYFDFEEDFKTFAAKAKKEIEKVQQSKGLITSVTGDNIIHYSFIPWLDFTGLSHARMFSRQDSIPKICFGKMTEEGGRRYMPMSVHGHHGLMDGYHISRYVDLLTQIIGSPDDNHV
jgi:chloramphenicol O-acetyltransferase type A